MKQIGILNNMDEDEVFAFAKQIAAPYNMTVQTKQMGEASGGSICCQWHCDPTNAALMTQLGCDEIFVGNNVFNYANLFK